MTVGTTQLAPGNGHNYVINGAFDIWQRGTSGFPTSNIRHADRWFSNTATAVSQSSDVPPGADVSYSVEISNTSGVDINIRQMVELPVTGKEGPFISGTTFTVSFYVKSTVAGDNVRFYSAFASSVSGSPIKIITSAVVGTTTTSWQRVAHTFTVPEGSTANATGVEVVPFVDDSQGTVKFTGVQLEAGSVATPFKRHASSLQGELAACQRYYIQTPSSYPMPGGAIAYKINGVACSVQFPSQMRATPSLTITGFRDATNGTTSTVSSLNAEFTNDGIAQFLGAFSAGSLTVGRAYSFGYTADAEL